MVRRGRERGEEEEEKEGKAEVRCEPRYSSFLLPSFAAIHLYIYLFVPNLI